MKNQYFGDNRDLFKYDLVYQIMRARLVDHFTFIPMLTRGQGEEDDRRKAKAGKNNDRLVTFLDECRRQDGRNINQLENFFKGMITIYKKDDEDKYFSDQYREGYFSQIADELLSKSLILVDPDKGLQVEKSGKEHILYCEVKTLYDRMDRGSVLMIFQYFPHEDHVTYLHKRSEQLRKQIAGDLPLYIDDGINIYFFLTRENELLRESLGNVISKYGKAYDLRVRIT